PSFVAAADDELPDDIIFDGYNWWPALRVEAPSPRNTLFWKRRDQCAARVGSWKWVRTGDRPTHLANLEDDVAEQENRAETDPEKTVELESAFKEWLSKMEATEPRGPFRDY
ncbi:MAG: N-acetylgalactosamine-6-sulfatase, partial [Verrucomicrobiota bacterium]